MSELKHICGRKQKLVDKIKSKKRKKARKRANVSTILKKIDKSLDIFDYDKAVKWTEKGLEVHPGNLILLDKAGPVFLEAGLVDKAHSCFLRAAEVSPESGAAKYLYLGQLSSGKEAVTHLLKGIELLNREEEGGVDKSHDLSAAYCSLAEVYLTDECFSDNADVECLNYCKKAIASCPTNPEAYQLMASYLLSRDKTEEACSTLLKGIDLWLSPISAENEEDESNKEQQPMLPVDPPAYESRINCAKLLVEVGQYDRAIQVLNGLIREDDEVLEVWYLLGWCYHQMKELSSSRSCLSKVIELNKKFDCDQKELIEHSQELLQEIESKWTEETEHS